jgi:hypothetical protein
MPGFSNVLSSEAELRQIFRPPARGAVVKQIDHLDANCRAFIEHAPFVVIGTTGANGAGDVSPKGGPPGFVRVLDEHRLAMGELPGNNRLDGFVNLVNNPAVGLLFLIPGTDETLRVNGRGYIVTDPEVIEVCALDGKLPTVALGVEVTEAFIHCAKALRRSQLWEPEAWPSTADMPTIACMMVDHMGIEGDPGGVKVAAALESAYATTLWNQ